MLSAFMDPKDIKDIYSIKTPEFEKYWPEDYTAPKYAGMLDTDYNVTYELKDVSDKYEVEFEGGEVKVLEADCVAHMDRRDLEAAVSIVPLAAKFETLCDEAGLIKHDNRALEDKSS